ncbi:ABC transporter permease [Planctomycetota bacterium]|nr:ABC transporter permease [Planctomycetota bacterium]
MSTISTQNQISNTANSAVITIKPRKNISLADLFDLWLYRDLIWTLSVRDIQIRYKQTILGAAWAVIQPLATSGVATIIFGKFLGLASNSLLEYFLSVFPAMILWTLFASILTQASNSLLSNAEMLRKVYFPRLIIPISSAGAPLLDFSVSTVTLILVLAIFAPASLLSLSVFPLILLSVSISALGLGIALSALTAIYRDFRLILAFITQLLFFLTPIMYPLREQIPSSWLPYFSLNPMFGTISALKASLNNIPIDTQTLLISIVSGLVLFIFGIFIFGKIERRFADVI